MHELSITQSVVDAVADHVDGRKVTVVCVRIGRLSGIVPDSMRFCFELVTDGTVLEGAMLEIEEPDGEGRCRTCGEKFLLFDLILLCPCGSADVQVISGRQLSVTSVEVV